MYHSESSYIENTSLHLVGNKSNEENIRFSSNLLNISTDLNRILLHYFLSSFKSNEFYNFYHDINIEMNEVYVCLANIFKNNETLHTQSINLAKHLYKKSTHPQIKGGEFYTVYFKDCILEGEIVDAIGLFKSENKDTFLKVSTLKNDFKIETVEGVNINKLDKGCLIFNKECESGYIVTIVDNTNKGIEAQYWLDDFLSIRQRNDEYHDTQNILSLCKNFIKKELPKHFEISKADQAELLNKSVSYFKNNENFNMKEFASEVICQPEIINTFNQYKSSFQEDYDIRIADNFTISESAVKKQVRSIKSVIKLDKNFDIYIHGNSELIEQGEDSKGKFYKMYYTEES